MVSKAKRIEEALQLTPRERIQLAERLTSSLNEEGDQGAEGLCLKEVGLSYKEYKGSKGSAVFACGQDELSWFEKNFEQLLEKYDGQWPAVYKDRLVATGSTMIEAWQNAKNNGCESPFLVSVGRKGWGLYGDD